MIQPNQQFCALFIGNILQLLSFKVVIFVLLSYTVDYADLFMLKYRDTN